ncbi:MAG: TonB-dependent receptor [Chitinophagaceae bacterium]|nr:TonB-dependent receptor [Chitinophagaceae bacterium]
MKYAHWIFLILLLFSRMHLQAQEIAGAVFGRDDMGMEMPLADANVVLAGTGNGTSTDATGKFHLSKTDTSSNQLFISYTGYVTDTLKAEGTSIKVVLERAVVLNGVEVAGDRPDSYISSLKTQKTEVITSGELKNNACCNLSESFESNPTVDVSFSDAVTGARQIQMLGLSGKYAQILTDVLPTVRGLGITYGLNFIPGPWIESINLNKGAGSVSNGYESITGQIDIELKKPEKSENLYVNLYGNSEQRLEANIYSAHKLNDKWHDMFLIHGSTMQRKMDENGDGFLDLPLNKTVSLMDRWKYESGKRIEAMFGVKFLHDDRIGGVMDFNPETDKLTSNAYGLGVNTNRVELFTKTSYGFPDKKFQSIGLQLSGIYHDQDAYYGLRAYNGTEQSFYANLIFLSIIGNTQHKYKAGLSYLYDKYDEKFDVIEMNRVESVPGAFFEYTYDNLKKLSVIAGVRTDWHNEFGFLATGRLHAKYKLGPTSTLRASIGNGFRVANIFAENATYMASSREWVIVDVLKPERAWNYGINFTQQFFPGTHEGTFSLDLYRTDFTNQVIVDADADPSKIFFYNLSGASYSNSLQADVSYEWFRGFNTRLAFKVYDVAQTYGDELKLVPLVPKQRALLTITYKTPDKHWEFSSTSQWVGVQRLPDTQSNPEMYQAPDESPSYFRFLGQISYLIKSWEFYVGGENLGNYVQNDRIIAADDPFGPYFDTSIVWGPITGRTIYGGLRFSIK